MREAHEMQDVAGLVDQELIPEQTLFYGKKFRFCSVSNGELWMTADSIYI